MVAQGLHHPLLLGLLIPAAVTVAVIAGVRSLLLRSLVLMAAVLIGLLAAVPTLLLAGSGHEVTTTEAAPHRSDRHLVVEEEAAMIDPLWWVYVDVGSGLTKRRPQIGYFNGDSSANALVEASWMGTDRVRPVTGAEGGTQVHPIDLEPQSDEAMGTLSRA